MKKIFFIIFLFYMSSCVKYYNLNIDTDTKIVVNGLLIAGKPVEISISLSKKTTEPIDTIIFNLISDAYVILESDMGEKTILDTTSNYPYYNNTILEYSFIYYTDSIIPKAGHTYFLKVFVQGFDTVFAQTVIPYPANITEYNYYNSADEESIILIGANIFDSLGQDYYWFIPHFFSNSLIMSTDPATDFILGTAGAIVSDKSFDGQEYTYYFSIYDDPRVQENIDVYRINYDLYLYLKAYQLTMRNEIYNPFREPVIVYSNIKNGLGIFAAMSKPDTITITKKIRK